MNHEPALWILWRCGLFLLMACKLGGHQCTSGKLNLPESAAKVGLLLECLGTLVFREGEKKGAADSDLF